MAEPPPLQLCWVETKWPQLACNQSSWSGCKTNKCTIYGNWIRTRSIYQNKYSIYQNRNFIDQKKYFTHQTKFHLSEHIFHILEKYSIYQNKYSIYPNMHCIYPNKSVKYSTFYNTDLVNKNLRPSSWVNWSLLLFVKPFMVKYFRWNSVNWFNDGILRILNVDLSHLRKHHIWGHLWLQIEILSCLFRHL